MKNPHAQALGRKGGQAKSKTKAKASRANGRNGGRPKKERKPGQWHRVTI